MGTYAKELDEKKLRLFLKEEIDIKTKDYLNHIASWVLMRKLNATKLGKEADNDIYGIQLKPVRAKTDSTISRASLMRKISFLPKNVTT